MAARSIVEAVDVVGDVVHSQRAVLVDVLFHPLLLQATEERLRDRVVPAVAPPAHARLELIGTAEAAPGVAAVLCSLIRMDQRSAGASSTHSLQYRLEHEFLMKGRTRRP